MCFTQVDLAPPTLTRSQINSFIHKPKDADYNNTCRTRSEHATSNSDVNKVTGDIWKGG